MFFKNLRNGRNSVTFPKLNGKLWEFSEKSVILTNLKLRSNLMPEIFIVMVMGWRTTAYKRRIGKHFKENKSLASLRAHLSNYDRQRQ